MAYTRTKYPSSFDKNNTDQDKKQRFFWRSNLVDFEDRGPNTSPLDYYVLSEDILTLQEAIFALQETLGIKPQGSRTDVNNRITVLENASRYDIRFGGPSFTVLHDRDLAPTILSHRHNEAKTVDNIQYGASKISLTEEVTGLLPAANINCDAANGGLTANHIIDTVSNKSISQRFNDKYDKTGGPINGDLTVLGNINSKIFKEIDVADVWAKIAGLRGTAILDNAAYSGKSVRYLFSDSQGLGFSYTSALRYGYYAAAIRLKLTSKTYLDEVCKFTIKSGSVAVAQYELLPTVMSTTEYETIFVSFDHRSYSGSKDITIEIQWYGNAGNCDMYVDSIVVSPVNISVYDMSNTL